MLKQLIKYIKLLRRNAFYYECLDINGKIAFSKKQLAIRCALVSLISCVFILCIPKGFSSNFIDLTCNVLAIFIGLFSTTLIFGFDNLGIKKNKLNGLYEITVSNKEKDSEYRINTEEITYKSGRSNALDKQEYNYAMKFAYSTGWNIVMCIIALFLLLLGALFDTMSYDPFSTRFTSTITCETIIPFIVGSIVLLQRFLVFYLMINIFIFTIYMVSSLVQMMTIKIKRGQ